MEYASPSEVSTGPTSEGYLSSDERHLLFENHPYPMKSLSQRAHGNLVPQYFGLYEVCKTIGPVIEELKH